MTPRLRKILIGFLLVVAVLLGRLYYIQVVETKYKISSQNNSLMYVDVHAPRGLIEDRAGRILVDNSFRYELNVCPREVAPFDTAAFCRIFDVDREFVDLKFAEYKKYRRRIGYKTLTMIKNISEEQYSRFLEVNYLFQGFSLSVKTLRNYPVNAGGALLGYISEVSERDLKKHPDYKMGSLIGRTGIEATEDARLRGEMGYEIYLRDSKNKRLSPYQDGAMNKPPQAGETVVSTIDATLQEFAQGLMQGRKGALVAIEPATGEILTLVSSPTIDVSDLANIGANYARLASDPGKPMFNRAVQAAYPPGSVFKTLNGLIALQEGIITPYTKFECHSGYYYGNGRRLGCHSHRSPIDLEEGIMMSCNAYFCNAFKYLIDNPKYGSVENAYNLWYEYLESFGFGHKLGSDFPQELAGNLPKADYFNKIYGKGHWRSSTIISLSIGQGELGCTPMHLANLCATIANRGYYITPHIVKHTESTDSRYTEKHYTKIDTKHFDPIVRGMYRAVNEPAGAGGTAFIAAVPGLDICGKTGTAENPHGAEHSVFMCFAPRENPQIAVCAFLENEGFGARLAAPIASLVVEKYLTGEVSESRAWMKEYVKNYDVKRYETKK